MFNFYLRFHFDKFHCTFYGFLGRLYRIYIDITSSTNFYNRKLIFFTFERTKPIVEFISLDSELKKKKNDCRCV